MTDGGAAGGEDVILAVNSGSSSVKFALFAAVPGEAPALARGTLRDTAYPGFEATDAAGSVLVTRSLPDGSTAAEVFEGLLDWIGGFAGAGHLAAVGHRIVHGGEAFADPVALDRDSIETLEGLVPLAPLHQPRCLAPVRLIASLRPGLRQVGCFDTAFHRSIPAGLRRYGLPRRFEDEGIRKYGFHGLSYENIADRLTAMEVNPEARTVVAHLGSGASVCALHHGESRDTSMGFSVLDGLPMATRCGAIDPGILLYLQRERGMTAAAIEDLLYHESGLLGVSGLSGDIRELVASPDPKAADAVDFFTLHVARQVAVMANTLEGLDQLVFTGGIGEHQPEIRAAICARLAWLGIHIDEDANGRGCSCISSGGSRVTVLVIPADEERIIVRQTRACLASG